jgi:hypothetical protein
MLTFCLGFIIGLLASPSLVFLLMVLAKTSQLKYGKDNGEL